MAIGCLLMVFGYWHQQVDCLSLLVDLYPLVLHCYQQGLTGGPWNLIALKCLALL